ncbi:MAG: hypothetical protein HZB44_09385, partial [Actinobacteria bacterium]|nr:hypothetical protein [Actinomycetota bacterium]
LATGVEEAVCTNSSDQYNPVVAGNRIYWMDYRNNNWDVYMKDISSGTETRLTSSSAHQSWPSASGDFVVWKDTREGDEDIYMKNLANGVEQRVNTDPDTAPTAGQKIPLVSGPRVVWMDRRSGNWDIYSGRDEVAPQVASVAPSGIISGNSATVSALFSDGGTGVDVSTVTVAIDGVDAAGCAVTAAQVTCPPAVLPEGIHSINVSIGDYSGNQTSAAGAQFIVDTLAPAIGPIGVVVPPGTDTAMVDADIGDPAPGSSIDPATVQVTLDGEAQDGCLIDPAHVSCDFAGLSLGGHEVGISAADLAGNSSSLSRIFQVADTVAPVITSPGPVGAVLLGSGDPVIFSAAFSDDLPSSGIDPAAVNLEVDGVGVPGCVNTAVSLSCTLSGIADGSHQVVATVTDNAGNLGSLNWSINVNWGPDVTGLVPYAGAVVNDPTTPVEAKWSDAGDGVEAASIKVYLDGASMQPPGISLTAGDFSYQPDWENRLADGLHTVRVVIADQKGAVTDRVWSFTVTSPALRDSATGIYWESYASYLRRELSVQYQLTDSGTGECRDATVAFGTASGGVLPSGLPIALGSIVSGDAATYTIRYSIPAEVGSFMTLNYASCADDGGNIYWTPGPPPSAP